MTFQNTNLIIEPSFWHTLSKKKLNDMMLDERPFDATAYFQCGKTTGAPSYAFLNEESFLTSNQENQENQTISNFTHYLNYTANFPIQITLVNTKNNFIALDRKSILSDISKSIYDAIESKSWLTNPSLLLGSALTVYGDLKKWQFFYCFAFPEVSPVSVAISDQKELVQGEDEILNIKLNKENCPSWVFALDPTDNLKPIPVSSATSESTFVVIDPSTTDKLGWPVHLLSYAICKTFNVNQFKLIRLNCKPLQCTVHLPETSLSEVLNSGIESFTSKIIGWRLNKKKPFFVDLSSTMDPLSLFKSASYLNLRLMKWRMAPQLDVDKLHLQRALLIGCGTLGCNVARDLLGWGVRKFTLIDYGKVSFSNPPRQPLFTFEDCLNGGKPKSEAAAEELRRICPDVEVNYDGFEIPMPGHHCSEECFEKVKESVEKLDNMMQNHDVTFLLTDTRESRWLPTVIGAARGKLCISIALGFDTFSVVRSGSKNCGCYFCNDVVAPVDSMTDRTLDMQCTVTRPGMAPLASSIGVELWASIMQHPDGKDAKGDTDSILGAIPHQIRGFVNNWSFIPIVGERFKSCVGCSEKIVEAYLKDGAKFVMRAMNESNYLEDLSGITEMKAEMANVDCEWVDE